MKTITIPEVHCPFPAQINACGKDLHAYSLWLVQHFRLIQHESALQHFTASRFGWFIAQIYPYGSLQELTVVCDWHIIFFLFDDYFSEGKHGQTQHLQLAVERLSAILNNPATQPQGPLEEAFCYFWRRALAASSLSWQQRFARNFTAYLQGCLWEKEIQGQIPDLATYIEKRRLTAGVGPAFDLIEIALQIDLPPQVWKYPQIQELCRTAGNIACWVNDLYSLAKELADGEVQNLVLVLQHTCACTLQEAAERAGEMIEQETRRFIELEHQLPSFPPDLERDVQAYVTNIQALLRGNLDWSRETARYSTMPVRP